MEISSLLYRTAPAAGICAIASLLFAGCKPPEPTVGSGNESDKPGGGMTEAVANLAPTQGNETKGTVTFTRTDNGVRVVADITGLKEGMHGFHIHAKGDCSAPDASSAGDHFNPTAAPHGAPGTDKHHIGDLGNLNADASGKAHLEQVFPFLKWDGTNSIVGRAVIVHANKDDLTTQPSGDAGARLACGVITLKQ